MNAFAVERQVTNRAAVNPNPLMRRRVFKRLSSPWDVRSKRAAVNPLMRRRVLNVQAFVLAVGRQVSKRAAVNPLMRRRVLNVQAFGTERSTGSFSETCFRCFIFGNVVCHSNNG